MDRFLVDADADRRRESIEITREVTQLRSRLHDLGKEEVSWPNQDLTSVKLIYSRFPCLRRLIIYTMPSRVYRKIMPILKSLLIS
jgi:hypothetical protein